MSELNDLFKKYKDIEPPSYLKGQVLAYIEKNKINKRKFIFEEVLKMFKTRLSVITLILIILIGGSFLVISCSGDKTDKEAKVEKKEDIDKKEDISANKEKPQRIVITYVKGLVRVKSISGTRNASKGMILRNNDSVITTPHSKCKVRIGEGSKASVMSISMNTKVKISALIMAGDKNTTIDLASGRVIANPKGLTKKARFRVNTPTAVCGVRGTIFSVTVSGNKDTKVSVKEGAVEFKRNLSYKISNKNFEKAFEYASYVKANQSASITHTDNVKIANYVKNNQEQLKNLSTEKQFKTAFKNLTEKEKIKKVETKPVTKIEKTTIEEEIKEQPNELKDSAEAKTDDTKTDIAKTDDTKTDETKTDIVKEDIAKKDTAKKDTTKKVVADKKEVIKETVKKETEIKQTVTRDKARDTSRTGRSSSSRASSIDNKVITFSLPTSPAIIKKSVYKKLPKKEEKKIEEKVEKKEVKGTAEKILWTYKVGSSKPSNMAIGKNGFLYFGIGSTLYCINPTGNKGVTKWKRDVGSRIGCIPIVEKNVVYIVTATGNIIASDADKGTEKWSTTGGTVMFGGGLAIHGKSLYYGSTDSKVYSVNIDTGSSAPILKAQGNFIGIPAVTEEKVFIAGDEGILYGIDKFSNEVKLKQTLKARALSTKPITSRDESLVVIADTKGYIKCYHTHKNLLVWEYKTASISSAPVRDAEYVIYGDSAGNILKIKIDQAPKDYKAKVSWKTTISGGNPQLYNSGHSMLAIAGKNIYFFDTLRNTIVWNTQASEELTGNPVMSESYGYVLTASGKLMKLNLFPLVSGGM